MLSRIEIEQVLEESLRNGADFAELFFENTESNRITYHTSVEDIVSTKNYGVGIRLIKGHKSVYATSNQITLPILMELAKKTALALNGVIGNKTIHLTESIVRNISPVIYVPSSCLLKNKIEIIKTAHDSALDFSSQIAMVQAGLVDVDRNILIANSDGLYVADRRIQTRLSVTSVANDGMKNQSSSESPGASMGLELFQQIDPSLVGTNASKVAAEMLLAKNCPAGKMPVAIENGFGGVIFHEACGHSLEGEQIAKGNSEFTHKMGQQIASTKVTAIDDGTIPNAWGSINIDDEGHIGQKNVLIENGILKSFMLDKHNAEKIGLKSTGSGRRQGYQYPPSARMTNTYIANGTDTRDEIISSIESGIYAKKMGGGQVDVVTGDFNFSVAQGYYVKNGEIQYPVTGASLVGKGSKILQDIDMVSDNMDMAQGVCGSISGQVPTNVGQPLIRVREITVGGK